MTLFRLGLIVALVLPGILPAQRRGPPRGNVRGDAQYAPPELTTKDLQNLNPAKIALEQRKDLGLSTDQLSRFDSLGKAFDLEAKNFGKAVDTLQDVMRKAIRHLTSDARSRAMRAPRDRPKSPKDSIERARSDSVDLAKIDREQERYMAARNALASTLLIIRETYDARIATINSVLTDEQRQKIAPWFEGASEELTTRLHWANARSP